MIQEGDFGAFFSLTSRVDRSTTSFDHSPMLNQASLSQHYSSPDSQLPTVTPTLRISWGVKHLLCINIVSGLLELHSKKHYIGCLT